jgi:anti-anti-sigma factor
MKLNLETDHGEIAIVRLLGELDIAGCEEFEQALSDAGQNGAHTVVVDLSELDFLDSSGLRSLLKAHGELREKGVRLAVVRGTPAVHRVFQITRTDQRLEFVDDLAEVASQDGGAG